MSRCFVILTLLVGSVACDGAGASSADVRGPADADATAKLPKATGPRAQEREQMVRDQLLARGISDREVLTAMMEVPRHAFVPDALKASAYADAPLPIGHDATISQPYIVALMTELADVEAGDEVLDVGTGSGYQAAVLAQMGATVYGIEIVEPLAEQAARRLAALGYDEAHIRAGDGYRGWPEHAPFDAIIVAAAAPAVPEPLEQQLAVGGKLVVPVCGDFWGQSLLVIERTAEGYETREVSPVSFVPMVGEARRR